MIQRISYAILTEVIEKNDNSLDQDTILDHETVLVEKFKLRKTSNDNKR